MGGTNDIVSGKKTPMKNVVIVLHSQLQYMPMARFNEIIIQVQTVNLNWVVYIQDSRKGVEL